MLTRQSLLTQWALGGEKKNPKMQKWFFVPKELSLRVLFMFWTSFFSPRSALEKDVIEMSLAVRERMKSTPLL